ncbi:hypothetical protein TNIN_387471 [Trichonephila inaurata madagascariensis]|uniref:Uncharacterized protein n=1 Tax=Trichonephila inaurata madagascariensis TaxID=2747483 RepID=A0A8X7CU55_9ARAC|nr:hypothetical protein TNIN_387471 [Trichonephila inaurata madagascariensis]
MAEASRFPASKVALQDVYMDDVVILRCFGGSLWSRSVHALCQRRWYHHNQAQIAETRRTNQIIFQIPRLLTLSCLLCPKFVEKFPLTSNLKIILHTDLTKHCLIKSSNQLKNCRQSSFQIQTLTENFEWKHIPSAQNPVDIISLGVNPEELSIITYGGMVPSI